MNWGSVDDKGVAGNVLSGCGLGCQSLYRRLVFERLLRDVGWGDRSGWRFLGKKAGGCENCVSAIDWKGDENETLRDVFRKFSSLYPWIGERYKLSRLAHFLLDNLVPKSDKNIQSIYLIQSIIIPYISLIPPFNISQSKSPGPTAQVCISDPSDQPFHSSLLLYLLHIWLTQSTT